MRSSFKFFSVVCFFVFQLLAAQSQQKPNVIVIIADDLGYSDLGCYGGEIETPALDAMASKGIRLSNMHNASMCVVSRTSLLTGEWWIKAGKGIEKGTNIAQKLKKNGYRTGLVGKWHLNGEPNKKGFDYFYGFLGGYASYFNGGKDYRLNQEKFTQFGENFYSTDAFTDRAISFVKQKEKSSDAPFFLYLSYQSPHNPLQAAKEDIYKYRGKYLKGWQAVREERYKKQLTLGIVDKNTKLPAYPENLPNWEDLSDAQKDLEDLRMSVYAAMVDKMDQGIGKLLKALKETNQDKNTLILFMSDNGTDSFSVMDKHFLKVGLLPGDAGSNYQLGRGWAYASVTPYRLYKISQHGGGVKTGAIAYWPNVIQNSGRVVNEPMHYVDIVPTLLEATQTPNVGGKGQALSGVSFYPLLQGKKWKRKEPMFFQFADNRGVRTSKWSLLEVDGSGWELFCAGKDPLEAKEVSKKYPKVVKKLNKTWNQWWNTYEKKAYVPKSTANSPHYSPQGDRGSGVKYVPSAMPAQLKDKYPIH